MYKNLIIGIAILLVIGFVFFGMTSKQVSNQTAYVFEPAGFRMEQLLGYVYEEERTDATVRVSLKNKNSDTSVSEVPTEGEPRISCLIVPNASSLTVPLWVESSTYQQTDGRVIEESMYPSIDIPDIDAVGFKTDGLYATDHVAFSANNHLIDCSVSYITEDDPLRMDFVSVLSGITIKQK